MQASNQRKKKRKRERILIKRVSIYSEGETEWRRIRKEKNSRCRSARPLLRRFLQGSLGRPKEEERARPNQRVKGGEVCSSAATNQRAKVDDPAMAFFKCGGAERAAGLPLPWSGGRNQPTATAVGCESVGWERVRGWR